MDKRFEELLLAYGQAKDPLQRGEIEARLWQEFGVTRAVLVMDLSRFSNMTERYGIVYNLSVVQRMRFLAQPLIEQAAGRLIKSEADNCFALFEDVPSALRAAVAIHKTLEQLNLASEEPFDLRVGIGIDYGEVLLTGAPDYFGMTVNRACKLGEDLASPGEVLISESAFLRLPPGSEFQAEPLELTIAGISLPARRIVY